MGSKLADVGASLDVNEEDIQDVRISKRREVLIKIARVFAPAASAILGIVAAESAYPVESRDDVYPYASPGLILASSWGGSRAQRGWAATIIASVVLFIVAFVMIALLNGAANDSYGGPSKYGVFARRSQEPGGPDS